MSTRSKPTTKMNSSETPNRTSPRRDYRSDEPWDGQGGSTQKTGRRGGGIPLADKFCEFSFLLLTSPHKGTQRTTRIQPDPRRDTKTLIHRMLTLARDGHQSLFGRMDTRGIEILTLCFENLFQFPLYTIGHRRKSSCWTVYVRTHVL